MRIGRTGDGNPSRSRSSANAGRDRQPGYLRQAPLGHGRVCYDALVVPSPRLWLLLPASLGLSLAVVSCARLRDYDDADGDGWINRDDCKPRDADIHPGVDELCADGLDNNCNGLQDEFCGSMGDLRYKELCGVNARGDVVCWHDATCGVNDVGDVVCWDPTKNLPLLAPQLSMAELEVWARYPCGRSAFGEVECLSPIRVASMREPDGTARTFSAWDISPAFRTLTPILDAELHIPATETREIPQ